LGKLSGIFWKRRKRLRGSGESRANLFGGRTSKLAFQVFGRELSGGEVISIGGEVISILLCFGRYRGVVGNSFCYFGDEGKIFPPL
jgi:hypothetical protein